MTINDVKHAKLVQWVNEIAALTTPDAIVLADGSAACRSFDAAGAADPAGYYSAT